jgi:hypothetical protein
MNLADLGDLEVRGAVHVPGFLSEAELVECREDFASQPVSDNKNYGLSNASGRAIDAVKEKVKEVLAAVAQRTDLRANLPLGAAYFATGRGIRFPWHQDHESFFTLQNHYDYLNFYIPIAKPLRDKSNLSVIPFDALERECPRLYPLLARGGATRLPRFGRRRMVFFDDRGSVRLMKTDLARIAWTPPLDPGDLLLLRGDVIHQTQDMDTERVALSFRASSSTTVVSRRRLADGSLFKARMMAKNPTPYERMFRAFDENGRDAFEAGEFLQVLQRTKVENPRTGRAFLSYLLSQKRREGLLARFTAQVSTSLAADRLLSLDERFRRN